MALEVQSQKQSHDLAAEQRRGTFGRVHFPSTVRNSNSRRLQMGDPSQFGKLSEALHFNPKIWWDPVPPWVWDILDKAVQKELTVIQLEFQKAALDAQSKAIDRTIGAISKSR
jgi:hypothetical protein